MYPPNYNQTVKLRDLLGTPDPKDEIPTVQIQSLRSLRAKSSVNNREIRMVKYNEKRVRHQDLLFWEHCEGSSKSKKL